MSAHTSAPAADDSIEASLATEEPWIRRAGVEDAPVVHTLLMELAHHEHSAHAVRATADHWRQILGNPAVLVLIAYIGGHPVGYVSGARQLNLWVAGEVLAVDDLYVRSSARNRGVGGKLMGAVARFAAPDGLLITWGVEEHNEAGQRFYRRLGATLRTKVVASWRPQDYNSYLNSESTTPA